MHDVDGCDGDDKELPSGFGLNTTQPTPTLGSAGYILLLTLLLLLLLVVDGRSLEVEEHLMVSQRSRALRDEKVMPHSETSSHS